MDTLSNITAFDYCFTIKYKYIYIYKFLYSGFLFWTVPGGRASPKNYKSPDFIFLNVNKHTPFSLSRKIYH